jgi:hypothetical protein
MPSEAGHQQPQQQKASGGRRKGSRSPRYFSLTSICIISHHPFLSNFMECASVLKQLVSSCEVTFSPSSGQHIRHPHNVQSAWDLFIEYPKICDGPTAATRSPFNIAPGKFLETLSRKCKTKLSCTGLSKAARLALHDIREIETWIARLLQTPVPVAGDTRIELELLPRKYVADRPPLIFALPDNTRFSLCDFPLHLPLELLGVNKCLQVRTDLKMFLQ